MLHFPTCNSEITKVRKNACCAGVWRRWHDPQLTWITLNSCHQECLSVQARVNKQNRHNSKILKVEHSSFFHLVDYASCSLKSAQLRFHETWRFVRSFLWWWHGTGQLSACNSLTAGGCPRSFSGVFSGVNPDHVAIVVVLLISTALRSCWFWLLSLSLLVLVVGTGVVVGAGVGVGIGGVVVIPVDVIVVLGVAAGGVWCWFSHTAFWHQAFCNIPPCFWTKVMDPRTL